MPTRAETAGPAAALAAQAWAEVCDLLDLQLSPLGLAALAALGPQPGEAVLDVGCGAGQTVLQLAERVGPAGRVIGVDIAPGLLEVARRRSLGLSQVELIEGDAQSLSLPDHSIDAAYSRFGVMAFANPAAAFAGFHRALKPGGRLGFVCWRALAENELDILPLKAAGLEQLADLTPFSFDAADHIRATLSAAGFAEIKVSARDTAVSSGDGNAMTTVLLKVGPLGRIVRENPRLRAEAEPRVRAALASRGNPVFLNAATWVVTARA